MTIIKHPSLAVQVKEQEQTELIQLSENASMSFENSKEDFPQMMP